MPGSCRGAIAEWSSTDIGADILGFSSHPQPHGKGKPMAMVVATPPKAHPPSVPWLSIKSLCVVVLCWTLLGPGPGWTLYADVTAAHDPTRLCTPLICICSSKLPPVLPLCLFIQHLICPSENLNHKRECREKSPDVYECDS